MFSVNKTWEKGDDWFYAHSDSELRNLQDPIPINLIKRTNFPNFKSPSMKSSSEFVENLKIQKGRIKKLKFKIWYLEFNLKDSISKIEEINKENLKVSMKIKAT